ncbi:MAG: UvrB/UvrC motif-containing protein [Phycisphaerae bacterium]
MDISRILEGWPFEHGQVTARRILGADGREKIQLRLDLGLIQMETQGRPDGKRPHGQESYLAYYEQQLQQYRTDHGDDQGFTLDERACELLRAEGAMFYQRYVAEFVLEDFEAVERDTLRNLRMFDLCNAYAKEDSDKFAQEQFRPYVIMMCTRARTRIALRDNRPKLALITVRKAMDQIRAFYKRYGHEKAAAASGEIAVLRALAKEIEGRIPADPVQELKKKLARAVSAERYEEAARIRDELNRITGQGGESAEKGELGGENQ